MAKAPINPAPMECALTPRSFLDGTPTRPWCRIPGDHLRPTKPEEYDLYWDPLNHFGMIHPRAADPWETLAYYETEGDPYCTHSASSSAVAARSPRSLPVRLLIRLAYSQDWSTEFSEQEVDRYCPRRPATILDIGCGRGDLLARCRDLGHIVHGVEPDPQPLAAARARGLDVHAGTCEDLPEPISNLTFDVIIAKHVIHHCIDPIAALTNIAERLGPGGRLICEVPNQECLGARWSGIAWEHLDIPRQANVFTRKSLTRLIERSSLQLEEVRWAQYCRQFQPKLIARERRKYNFFKARGSPRRYLPVKPSLLSRYGLLACSLFASPRLKYDALRIIARKVATDR
jgi:SAM-dependent methyltransferase